MNIHLSEELEQIVHDAVRADRYPHEDDVIRDALTRLQLETPKRGRTPARTKPKPAKPPLTRAEFDQHLLAIGLLSQLPDTDAEFDDPDDEPIEIRGEPLSETVIRDRR